jgi:hypothetical protein
MLSAYRAILDGNQIKWIDTPPKRTRPIKVEITLLGEMPQASLAERGQAMAEAMGKLAQTGAFSEITDPVVWQREARQERVLPGRES